MLKSRIMCDVFEKQYASITEAVTSATLLTILGFIGGIGNILVIVVYCIKPRQHLPRPYIVVTPPNALEDANTVIQASPLARSTLLRQKRQTQTHLILLLAMVDLFTCLFVLPCDVLRSIHFVLHLNENRTTSESNNEKTGIDYVTLSSSTYLPDEILNLLRNLAFAGEGSILASIAIDRFLLLVPHAQLSCKQLFCARYDSPKADSAGRRCTQSENSSFLHIIEGNSKKISDTNLEMHDRPRKVNTMSCCSRCSAPLCARGFNQKLIVWGLILIVCFTVFGFEMLVLVLHLESRLCGVAYVLRELVDKMYIVSTLISFFVIAYLYVSIFLLVRRSEIRRLSWHSSRKKYTISQPGYSVEPIVPVEEDSEKNTHDEYSSKILTESGGPDIREPFVMARSYKYVSFTGTKLESSTDRLQVDQAQPQSPTNQFIAFAPTPSKKDLRTRMIRSRRTGLMLFISTLIFYTTLFPLLLVHVRWWFEDSENVSLMNSFSVETSEENNLNTSYPNLEKLTSPMNGSDPSMHTRMSVHHEFYYVNNAINVFIYSLLNSRFRERLRMLLGVFPHHSVKTLSEGHHS